VERSKRDLAVMYSKADRVYGASVVRTDAMPAERWKSLELKSADSAALPVVEATATAVPSAWAQHGLIPPLKPVDEAQAATLRSEYVLNMNRKMRHLNGLSAEHAKNESEIDGLVFADLRKASALKEVKVVKRSERREKNFVKLRDAETHRLFEILGEDKDGRAAERLKDRDRDIMSAYKPPPTRIHH
jgi:flagellar motility protein MotE (MotC chaperone)